MERGKSPRERLACWVGSTDPFPPCDDYGDDDDDDDADDYDGDDDDDDDRNDGNAGLAQPIHSLPVMKMMTEN